VDEHLKRLGAVMEVRPGYKQTEVGVIPEDWQTTKVGEVCGCIVPGRNKPKLFDETLRGSRRPI
jgi:hypothetical protein